MNESDGNKNRRKDREFVSELITRNRESLRRLRGDFENV